MIRPGNDELDQAISPPIQCPAATNCTDVNFCAADGTISTSPVNLTPEQQQFRVPLGRCRDESKGISEGVCCRDPNYTDPWPTNLLRTGAFDANVLAQAFDDGQYRPDNARNKKRGEALKSPINPINPFTASSQQTKQYTLAPFIPNANSKNNQPIKTSVSQQPTAPNPFNNQPNQQTFSPSSQFNSPLQNQPSQPKFVPQNQQPFASQPQQFTPLAQASTPQLVTIPAFPTSSPVNKTFRSNTFLPSHCFRTNCATMHENIHPLCFIFIFACTHAQTHTHPYEQTNVPMRGIHSNAFVIITISNHFISFENVGKLTIPTTTARTIAIPTR